MHQRISQAPTTLIVGRTHQLLLKDNVHEYLWVIYFNNRHLVPSNHIVKQSMFIPEVHKPCTSHSVRRCVQLSLHACKWCNGTARHVADKGWAAAVAEGKGNGLWVREIDDLPATVWWGVEVRQAGLHTCTVQCTRAGILCSSGLYLQVWYFYYR
jgi:hypothetical protein